MSDRWRRTSSGRPEGDMTLALRLDASDRAAGIRRPVAGRPHL